MAAITLTKTINAPAQKVCDQWLIPVFLEEWMFNRDNGEEVIKLENTVRKDGEFLFQVSRQGRKLKYTGEYLEMRIPTRIAFTWSSSAQPRTESQVTVQFDEDDDRTRMKFSMKLDPKLENLQAAIRSEWAARCAALADRFKK